MDKKTKKVSRLPKEVKAIIDGGSVEVKNPEQYHNNVELLKKLSNLEKEFKMDIQENNKALKDQVKKDDAPLRLRHKRVGDAISSIKSGSCQYMESLEQGDNKNSLITGVLANKKVYFKRSKEIDILDKKLLIDYLVENGHYDAISIDVKKVDPKVHVLLPGARLVTRYTLCLNGKAK